MADKEVENKLATNPLGHGPARVDIVTQFPHHVMETVDGVRYVIHGFEVFAYGLVNRDSRDCELQTTEYLSYHGFKSKRKHSR